MFTDIEGSTALTQRLGDARAQELLRIHNNLARAQIARFGGTEIKHTGDGVMATFHSASSAVAAATALQRESRVHNEAHPESSFAINVGLNAGEPVAEDADVFGSAVQLAARACATANGGQILATNVVRELVYGKGVLFEDQGFAELKGFDEPVRLFDVSGVEPDAHESAHERRRLPLIAAIVGVVAVVAAIAIVAVVANGESDNAPAGASSPTTVPGPDGPKHQKYSLQGSTEIVSVTGDCVTSDTKVVGRINQQARGDLVGESQTEYAATIELARECKGMNIVTSSTYTLKDGTFGNATRGFSLETLGDNVTSTRFSSTRALGFIENGTGAYEGVTGINICRSDSLRSETELTNTSACENWLYAADRKPPELLAVIADSEEVSTRIDAGDAANRFRALVAIQNTSDRALDGATISFTAPDGVEIRAVSSDGLTAASDLSWQLDALAAGEMRWLPFVVEVVRANAPELVLTPQITVDGKTTTGLPATVRVSS